VARFTVLHLCVGNVCRSPMSERLLAAALYKRLGDDAERRYLSHSAGIGPWHVGEPMSAAAARQVSARGGDPAAFRARRVDAELVAMSHLILTATTEQVSYVQNLAPDARGRVFLLGEVGRLLSTVDFGGLPPAPDATTAYARGSALVEALDRARADSHGGRLPALPSDHLHDPYGMSDHEYGRVADTIEAIVLPLADALSG
jgi:protein-tyrosine phosphatase